MMATAIAEVRPGSAPTTSPIRLPRKISRMTDGSIRRGRPMVRASEISSINRSPHGIGTPKPITKSTWTETPAAHPTIRARVQGAPRMRIPAIRKTMQGTGDRRRRTPGRMHTVPETALRRHGARASLRRGRENRAPRTRPAPDRGHAQNRNDADDKPGKKRCPQPFLKPLHREGPRLDPSKPCDGQPENARCNVWPAHDVRLSDPFLFEPA